MQRMIWILNDDFLDVMMGSMRCRRSAGPEQVLKYLARYTHRVAISNARLLDFEDGMVRFRYKDYAHGNRKRVMTLTATGVRPAAVAPRAADRVRADSPLRHPVQSPSPPEAGAVPSVVGVQSGGRTGTGVARGEEGDV